LACTDSGTADVGDADADSDVDADADVAGAELVALPPPLLPHAVRRATEATVVAAMKFLAVRFIEPPS
jgi:hypothetical protein